MIAEVVNLHALLQIQEKYLLHDIRPADFSKREVPSYYGERRVQKKG